MGHGEFQVGDLTVVVGDNAPHDNQRAGYNGLWSLRHRTGSRSIFVPGIAGLNFEHIVSGEGEEDRKVFFEPRTSEMTYRKVSDSEAELHQPPTHTHFLESWTNFKFEAPHYIDMTFRCRPTQHAFPHGYIALFWASYISGPNDKSMYFKGGTKGQNNAWSQLCTPSHNTNSTVRHREDDFQMKFADGAPNALYKNFSPLVFDEPFFYGNFENHIFLVMFDRSDGIRLTHSPSGGGFTKEQNTSNPAWDFQFFVPNYDVTEEYGFKARAVFRETCSREVIEEEFSKWKSKTTE
ncbi:MAG: hypothetical protein HKN23_14120 [Verrucomicrobiales bacterium]|nr:hypothetical protein [Verrucomicrobiales bacterium]